MTAKLVTLDRAPTKADALAAADDLRRAIEDGRIVAFVAVGVTDRDESYGYCGSVKLVSRLRMQGAIAQLQQDYIAGEL
jgi:hypothetical protein